MTSSTRNLEEARRVHDDAILVDGQGVTVLLPVAQIVPEAIDGVPWLDRAIAGGVTAQNVTLGIGGIGMGIDDFRALLGTMHGHYCYFEIEPRLLLVETAEDIRRAKREGRLGVIFGVQGLATKIEDDPSLVRILHRLGLRVGQMMYNERSSLGCGCLEQPDTGLTQLGKIVVREMNHVGIALDMAHAGDRTTLDAIDCSREPVIVSHGNVRALCDTPRNYGDDALGALAECGGGHRHHRVRAAVRDDAGGAPGPRRHDRPHRLRGGIGSASIMSASDRTSSSRNRRCASTRSSACAIRRYSATTGSTTSTSTTSTAWTTFRG